LHLKQSIPHRSFSEIAADCLALSGNQGDPRASSVSKLLMSAIHHDRLVELMAAYRNGDISGVSDEDQAILDLAQSAVASINAEIEAHRKRLDAAMSAAGVPCEPIASEPALRQFQAFALGIERRDLVSALAVLAKEEYPLAAALSGGAITAIAATADHLELMRDGDSEMRLTLHWPRGAFARRLPRRLKPTMDDFRALRLPGAFWALYIAFHPVRAKLETWTGWRFGSGADPVLSQVSLGTPKSLVMPLLDAAGVSAQDRLVDIGCGDGRVVAQALEQIGCDVTGIEANAQLAKAANARLGALNSQRRWRIENRFSVPEDVRDATAVFLFQPMSLAAKLVPDILSNLPPGGRIILHEQTPLDPDLKPDQSMPVFSGNAVTVAHIWRK
jgi:SAM-dependent methyltransferase